MEAVEYAPTQSSTVHDDELVGELDALGVHFISGGDGRSRRQLSEAELLAGLAASPDTRVQLATIPLLLARPEVAQGAVAAVAQLLWQPRLLLCCYYTAAFYLQRKYASTLQAARLPSEPLPNLFAVMLQLPTYTTAEDGLRNLAQRQRQLCGNTVNWLGAYEHALQLLLRQREMAQRWSS
jgi:hypothetical protein